MRQHLLGIVNETGTLTGAKKEAGKFGSDDEIKSRDLLILRKYLINGEWPVFN